MLELQVMPELASIRLHTEMAPRMIHPSRAVLRGLALVALLKFQLSWAAYAPVDTNGEVQSDEPQPHSSTAGEMAPAFSPKALPQTAVVSTSSGHPRLEGPRDAALALRGASSVVLSGPPAENAGDLDTAGPSTTPAPDDVRLETDLRLESGHSSGPVTRNPESVDVSPDAFDPYSFTAIDDDLEDIRDLPYPRRVAALAARRPWDLTIGLLVLGGSIATLAQYPVALGVLLPTLAVFTAVLCGMSHKRLKPRTTARPPTPEQSESEL